MDKRILNIGDVQLQPRPPNLAPKGAAAERFDAKVAFLGSALGAKQLGYNITAIPPGKRAFPYHNHRVNEEMFYIIEGNGEVRIGDQTFPIKPGDVISCPAGGAETAHQIYNSGERELRFLAVSTQISPEIAEYPTTGSFGVLAQFPGTDGKPVKRIMFKGRESESLDYWEGE